MLDAFSDHVVFGFFVAFSLSKPQRDTLFHNLSQHVVVALALSVHINHS